jgi:hypothetical protein
LGNSMIVTSPLLCAERSFDGSVAVTKVSYGVSIIFYGCNG